MSLTYDLLLYILDMVCTDRDYGTLFGCSLVNREFSQAAAKLLYSVVVLSPPASFVLDLRQRSQELNGLFNSARLPYNTRHVLTLEIGGFLLTRSPPLNTFPSVLQQSLNQWPNLQAVKLVPQQYPEVLMSTILPILGALSNLRQLTVNSSCCDETCAPLLTQIENLESLTIETPSRAILQLLPEWLGRISDKLTVFCLKENCGSVTPGVLRSFIPHLGKIGTFSLGLSYSLTDDDIFSFLPQLPSLASLELRYYLQLRKPSVLPRLILLRSFTVRHGPIHSRQEENYLSKWIQYIVSYSPLRSLSLICEARDMKGPAPSFDGLAGHLGSKHHETLCVLSMEHALIGTRALAELCNKCRRIEQLSASVNVDVLVKFSNIIKPCRRLHTVSLSTPNTKLHREPDETSIAEFLQHGSQSLRRFSLNSVAWEGSWACRGAGGDVGFVVRKVTKRMLPWERDFKK